MQIFERLIRIREFERRSLPQLETLEDYDIVIEIGFHQKAGNPLTFKALLRDEIGAVATVRRRVQRLRALGLVLSTKSTLDRRATFLTLSPELLRQFRHYRLFFPDLAALPPASKAAVRTQLASSSSSRRF